MTSSAAGVGVRAGVLPPQRPDAVVRTHAHTRRDDVITLLVLLIGRFTCCKVIVFVTFAVFAMATALR